MHKGQDQVNMVEVYYFLAKTLAKVNFIWFQLFHVAKVLATTNSEPG